MNACASLGGMSLYRRRMLPAMLGIVLVPSGIVLTLRYDAAVSRLPSGASA